MLPFEYVPVNITLTKGVAVEYTDLAHTTFEKPVDDYLRVMTASPNVHIADVRANVNTALRTLEEARLEEVELIVMPELSLTGYSAADLFNNDHVLDQARNGLMELAEATKNGPAMVVGVPLEQAGVLYNCAAVLADGEISGVVPKSYIPNYNEFYEKRWFTSGKDVTNSHLTVGDREIPFGTDLLFKINNSTVGIEICEDAWAPINPGTKQALAGAEVIVNLSASNEIIGKTEFRRNNIVAAHAARLICAYVYASAGSGESNADVIYGGHQLVAENGSIIEEVLPFAQGKIVHDIDVADLRHERRVVKTWGDQASEMRPYNQTRTIDITSTPPGKDLYRRVNSHPFIPDDPETLNERCEEIFNNVAMGLAQRVEHIQTQGLVIGLSGGLDSTLALLIARYACDIMGKPYSFIRTVTMPGPASSNRTQDNATLLAELTGTTHKEISVDNLSFALMEAIGHDQVTEDITYENSQARMRTNILMNYANMTHSIVQGTGDMSENAQGWCTYNGDHMSMFNPNTSIPKTLVKHLVHWYAQHKADPETSQVLEDIVATPVSPELTGKGELNQETEDILGPYELHDFYLYNMNRRGYSPHKVGYLAKIAFNGVYAEDEIGKWLDSYLRRYTANQWKRDVMPNGTKTGSVSVSPRGDLRMAPDTSPNWYR